MSIPVLQEISKICTKCGEPKPPEDFYRDQTRSDGMFPWCKACHKADYQRRWPEIRDQVNERHRAARRRSPERFQRYDKNKYERMKADPARRLGRYRSALWAKYRVTPEQLGWLLAQQDFKCALCHRDFGDHKPHLDHDHACCPVDSRPQRSCGLCIRGYLCENCNRRVLPVLEQSPWLSSPALVEYLASRPFAGAG